MLPRSASRSAELEAYAATLAAPVVAEEEVSSPPAMTASAEEAETAATATAYSTATPSESQPSALPREESIGQAQAGAASTATSTAAKMEVLHSGDLPEVVKAAHEQAHVRQEYKEQLIDMLADFD